MWHPTIPETRQTMPPSEPIAEQHSDSIAAPDTMVAESQKAIAATTPGSEYWLP
jgi:hypothetical protein